MGSIFERIIVGCNGSRESEHAVDVAISLAASIGARVVLLGVATPPSAESQAEGYGFKDPETVKRQLNDQLTRMANSAMVHGVQIEVEVVEGDAEKQIEKHATNENTDLIVIGHRNISRLRHWLERSTSEALLNRAKASILVVHSPEKK